jgi:hypothetical protein
VDTLLGVWCGYGLVFVGVFDWHIINQAVMHELIITGLKGVCGDLWGDKHKTSANLHEPWELGVGAITIGICCCWLVVW